MLPDALEHVVLERLQRGLALLLDLHLDAVLVEEVLDVREVVVGVPDELRNVVREAVDLGARPGRRAGPRSRRATSRPQVDEQDRQPARNPRSMQRLTSGIQDQGDVLGRDRISRTVRRRGPAPIARAAPAEAAPAGSSAGQRPAASAAAVAQLRLGARRSASSARLPRRSAPRASPAPRPGGRPAQAPGKPEAHARGSMSVGRREQSRSRILFVGDVVGGIGTRTLLDAAARAARALRRRRSSSSTARTPPAASGSPRRSPASCSPPAST